jgi:RNA polymerase sigma-70 factor, ECF subfamily
MTTELSDREFMELVEQYRPEFMRYLQRNLWNGSDVEDVFAEGVLTAWEQRAKFRVGSNFRAWLYRILTNKFYVANRHTMRHGAELDVAKLPDKPAKSEEPDQAAGNPEWFIEKISDEVYDALGRLRPAERECLRLRALENCSYKEIARIMRIPVGTVMTHLARGRARAREHLTELRVA